MQAVRLAAQSWVAMTSAGWVQAAIRHSADTSTLRIPSLVNNSALSEWPAAYWQQRQVLAPCSLSHVMSCRSSALEGQHIHSWTCQGDLIVVFTQADQHCSSDYSMTYYGERDDCSYGSHGDGHVCLFTLTLQEPVHVIEYPGWYTPDYHHIMRHKWSPDSRQLMVYWRNGTHRHMSIACMSINALAERQVRLLLLCFGHLQANGHTSIKQEPHLISMQLTAHAQPHVWPFCKLQAFLCHQVCFF